MLANHARSALFYFILCSFLLLSNPVQASDYASCLAEKLQGITHDAAVKAITEACQAQYPNIAAANPARAASTAALIDSRYRDNGNGTITDTKTNLTWMRCSLGQQWTGSTCAGTAMKLPLNEALRISLNYSYAGHADWRVPTLEELDTLVQCPAGRMPSFRASGGNVSNNGNCHGNEYNRPKINTNSFPNTPSYGFWSSSTFAERPDSSWYIGFSSGSFGVAGANNNSLWVRLVRTDQ